MKLEDFNTQEQKRVLVDGDDYITVGALMSVVVQIKAILSDKEVQDINLLKRIILNIDIEL